MMVSNRNLLFQGPIFRFHVCFGRCIFLPKEEVFYNPRIRHNHRVDDHYRFWKILSFVPRNLTGTLLWFDPIWPFSFRWVEAAENHIVLKDGVIFAEERVRLVWPWNTHSLIYIYIYLAGGSLTPSKINIEPENDGLEDDFPFPGVYSHVPCLSSGVYEFFTIDYPRCSFYIHLAIFMVNVGKYR